MNEDAFFQRIQSRLRREGGALELPQRDVVGAPTFWQAYSLPPQDRLERFCRELERLGGQAEIVPSLEDLGACVARHLTEFHATQVAVWGGSFVDDFQLNERLTPYTVIPWPEETRESAIADIAFTEIGITGCHAAVADTGSVVLACGPGMGRSVSLLPGVHIVLVRASQMFTRLGEALASVCSGPQASSVNVITGPSRSSDIENDSTIGIHGPAAVIAIVLDDRRE